MRVPCRSKQGRHCALFVAHGWLPILKPGRLASIQLSTPPDTTLFTFAAVQRLLNNKNNHHVDRSGESMGFERPLESDASDDPGVILCVPVWP